MGHINLQRRDLLSQNEADKVDRPKKNDYHPVFLDANELQKLFEAIKGTKLELPVMTAAFYGLRRGEVVGLKWDAIDFERGTITINHTVTTINVDGKDIDLEQDSAKTKSSLRTLPLVGQFTVLSKVMEITAQKETKNDRFLRKRKKKEVRKTDRFTDFLMAES